MPAGSGGGQRSQQILVRVTDETYAGLQLAQPFVRRRSMQDLVGAIIDEFLEALLDREPGFRKAVAGLREAAAREDGVLARRTTDGARQSREDRRK